MRGGSGGGGGEGRGGKLSIGLYSCMKHTRSTTAFAFALLVFTVSCERQEELKTPAEVSPPPASTVTASTEPVPLPAQEPVTTNDSSPGEPAPTELKPVSLTENQKIERILSLLMESDAIFIRNKVEYDGKTAASHLRTKWTAAGSRIKTANDFIDTLASKSSSSGKPYQIRKKDGSTIPSQEWFRELLAGVEASK